MARGAGEEEGARLPGLLARLRVPLGFAGALAYVVLVRPSAATVAAALPFVLLGGALRVWASGHIRKNLALATGGPYAYTRHPLYLGSALLVLGFAVASGSPALGAALVALFALLYLPVVQREERGLRERFGAEYERWRAAVPALLVRLRPWPSASGGGFSWEAVRRHRELRAVLGASALLGYLVVRVLYTEAPWRP
jgi:protein-S-isoprenylcysteine O-methyltransferase Ste14